MIPDQNGWHLAECQLADYAGGRSTVAQAASVETHMTACAHCRARLGEVLPGLPIERMWQHILSATDPAPPRQRRKSAARTTTRRWMPFVGAPASGRRRIGFAVLALLLFLPLVVHPADARDDNMSVTAVAGPGDEPVPVHPVPAPAPRAHQWTGGITAFSGSRSDKTLTVKGRKAGLGDDDQIHVELNATAVCVNGGAKHLKAGNEQSVNAAGDFPVRNGEADFTLSVTAVFGQSCIPPMTVELTDVTVTDTTNGLTQSFPGTF